MSTGSSEAASDRWAQSLVGRDWEIFWVEEEDNDDSGAMAVEASVAADSNDNHNPHVDHDAPTEQQTLHDPPGDDMEMDRLSTDPLTTATTLSGQETVEEKQVEKPEESVATPADEAQIDETQEADPESNSMEEEKEEDDSDEEGSIINDWYDGRILGVEKVAPSDESPGGEPSYIFRIRFVGEETIYNVSLVPSKVRPSARGWVQRTVALLRPPLLVAGGEDENDLSTWESKLPPDTRTLQDQPALQQLEENILGNSSTRQQRAGTSTNATSLEANDPMAPATESTSLDFDRIQRLQYLLEAQILLRSKLAKIESPDGEDRFTDGVRAPSEPYVNHLVQCCRDLIQACNWYCKAWKLLQYVFEEGSADPTSSNATGHEQQTSFEDLTFEVLMDEYMSYGKDTIVNVATIDVDSCSNAGKRRLPVSPSAAASGRRTKRRRLKVSSSQLDQANGCENVVTAASELDKDMISTRLVDNFVTALSNKGPSWYETNMGTMFKALSHFIVQPLVVWKGQVGLILRNEDDIALFTGRNATSNEDKSAGLSDKRVEVENDCEVEDATKIEGCLAGESTSDSADKMGNTTNSDENDSGSDSDEDEAEPKFTYMVVQECVAEIRDSRVLSRFNLFDDTLELQKLLHDIERNENKARSLFSRLTEGLLVLNREKDGIVDGLTEIIKEIDAPGSPLCQIEPLSTQKDADSLIITKDDLLDALALREWFVNVERVKSSRERRSLVQALCTAVEEDSLPDLKHAPCLAAHRNIVTCWEEGVQSITKLYNEDQTHRSLAEKYETELLLSIPLECNDGFDSVAYVRQLQSALSALAETPTISITEEKISCRIDLIAWRDEARQFLDKLCSVQGKAVSFEEVRMRDDARIALRAGRSPSRVKLIYDLVYVDDKIDSEIRSFVSADLDRFCKPLVNAIEELYQTSSSWQERAESIIWCLRVHGNPHAGQKASAQKIPAMVDIKRIDDLVSEYAESQVMIDGNTELLSIQSDSYQWSQAIQSILSKDNVSFAEALSLVEKARDERPKGLISDPTRSVVDSIVDLLSWYQKLTVTFNEIYENLAELSSGSDALSRSSAYSELITNMVYPLLADGTDILEVYCAEYCSSRGITRQFKAQPERAVEMLDNDFNVRRSSKAVTSEKIQSNELMLKLLTRMISTDETQGFPLQLLLWFQWHLFVSDFVAPFDKLERNGLPRVRVSSLRNAIELRDRQPFVCDSIDLTNATSTQALLQTQSQEFIEFGTLIRDAEEAEEGIRAMFPKAKNLLRGSIQKQEIILLHLSHLKESFSMFKARSQGEGGVALYESLEGQLDSHIKIFGWLSRTFLYPILHQEESSFSSMEEASNDGSNEMRIPWDALVSLNDRIPKDVDGSGDFALCVMRVSDLYNACLKWNNEITTCTLLSNRGNKRRVATTSNADSEEPNRESNDGENASKLQMAKMELLARDPILRKVEMPRQKALNSMIQSSRQFEVKMREFLAQDYHGTNQDKSPFPSGVSLIGENGQFILYRLTLSPLFDLMLSSMKKLSQVGDNVFAETPGKDAFDWMSSAVAWIERLHFAVSTEAPFNQTTQKLIVIPSKKAKELCSLGEEIFLQTTDSTRQTLSSHGINVSTSALKKRLTVTLKKDGAHHSVGGIVMRWCPILFDALRADLLKTDRWHHKMQRLIAGFQRFDKGFSGEQKLDEEHLFRYFEYREKIRAALDEGQQSLIVMPKKEEISAFYNVLVVIQHFLDEHSTAKLNTKFSKQLYKNGSSLCDDRFALLDTLLYRQALAPADDGVCEDTMAFDGLASDKTFRDICRSNFEAAFTTAAKELRLDLSKGSDASSLCTLKAWEIENEMYNRYQQEKGETRVSEDYRNKARSLKSNLTPRNLTLCVGVMTGEIEVSVLVRMTPAQLADRKTKMEREKAKQAALKDRVLTPGVEELSNSPTPSPKRHNPPSPDKKPNASILHARTTGVEASASLEKANASTSNAVEDANGSKESDGDNDADKEAVEELPDDDGIPTLETDDVEEKVDDGAASSSSSILKLPSYKSSLKARPSKPPPPPPSLAIGKSWPTSGRGRRVNCCNGGEKFRVEVQGSSKLAFSVAFYQEDEDAAIVDDSLPETLVQKGRLKAGEFKKFLSQKLKGGKWQAVCLRLTTLTDMDSSVYKAFYKEFESKDRIAMFKVRGDSGSNLFLVTPKFHGTIRSTGFFSFPNETSTYAVVLTKR